MITIEDIAAEAKVAKSTVSNVFSGKKYVSPEIVARVKKICTDHDYTPNFYASTLSNKKTANIIGLFFGENKTGYLPYYNELIQSVLTEASIKDNSVLVYYGLDNNEVANRLKTGRSPIDGAILISPSLGDERFQQMKQESIPFVVIGNPSVDDPSIYSIDNDNEDLVSRIASDLIMNHHRKIALIDADKELTICQDREKAFLSAAQKNGYSDVEALIYNSKYSNIEDGYYYAARAIKEGCTGFIVANGFVAKGVYEAANDAGKIVGKDIEVFSLGFSYSAELSFEPSLSFAKQDYLEFGRKAVELLFLFLKNEEKPEQHRYLVPSRLHINESFIEKKTTVEEANSLTQFK